MFFYTFLFVFGLVIGSFLTAYTWRSPRGISYKKGRSICPKCKTKIVWYDNIPLVSFILLGGKCRNCKEKISLRYPAIEAGTAITFLIIGKNISFLFLNLTWTNFLNSFALPYFLFIAALFIAIFVIDIEQMLIPDEIVFAGLLVTSFLLFLVGPKVLFTNLLLGFFMAFVFICLHLITKGRGMGLGDVKLALLIGTILGFKLSLVWFFISFIIGAMVAAALVLSKKASFGDKIAFGPFMIISFGLICLFGQSIWRVFLF